MIYTYSELVNLKRKGIKLNWDEISKEQLESLFIDECISNNSIAELYDVSPEKVKYKRKKFGITLTSAKYMYQDFVRENGALFDSLNQDSKERLMGKDNIDRIAKALTHYFFRNGPVEDMHANGQLSESDMKTLNKFMVNKIAGVLSLVNDGEWLKLEVLLSFLSMYGTSWDPAEIDTSDVDFMFHSFLGQEDESIKSK